MKFSNEKIQVKKGFTLLETMMYFAIMSIFLFAISMFSLQILNSFRLSENIHEVQVSANLVTDKLIEEIIKADSVSGTQSIFNDDVGTLALNGPLGGSKFYLDSDDGGIYFQEDGSSAVKLNSDFTTASKLRFRRLTSTKTPNQIIIDGELRSVSTLPDMDHTFPFHLSVSLRKM